MKPPFIICVLIQLILARPGSTHDQGYCGTPQHQLNKQTVSDLLAKTAGLPDPNRHYQPKIYSIGESAQFYTYNFVTEKYQQITATLRASAGNINIWVEDTEWSNFHVSTGDVQNILTDLLYTTPAVSISPSDGIISIIHLYFGTPPDFDGDGLTDFLITDIKDGWKEGESFVAGYFNPIDQFNNGTIIGGSRISGSNERDLLYIDSYPGIFNQNSDQYEQVLATVSHEYQHLIHFNYDQAEEVWVNEGLSELSSFLCGYNLRNPSAYLSDTSIELTGWDNTSPNTLKHYAKSALWTYYIYEKLGAQLIKRITQTSLPGISGINSALLQQGSALTFSDLLPDFFMAITLNDVSVNGMYGFEYAPLIDLRAVPTKFVVDYPFDISKQQVPYSLQLYSLENGDSLQMQFFSLPTSGERFMLKKTVADEVSFESVDGNLYQDTEFGTRWLKEEMMSINSGTTNSVLAFDALARQKYYVGTLSYGSASTGDFNIQSTGNICANQFVAPYDSCILKSVRINSLESKGKVRIHVYQQQLQRGNYPAENIIELANVLENEWVTIDLQNLQLRRNKDETFDLGIEFAEYGVLGYAKTPAGLNRSFLKRSSDPTFYLLSDFKVDSETLSGIWLIKIEYSAPLHNKPEQPDGTHIPYTINLIGPNPFPTPGNSSMRIQYTLQKPGQVNITVFDVLGQKIKTIFSGFDQGPIGVQWWDGTNTHHKPVATGSYYLRFTYNKQSEVRKILLLR